MRIHRIEIEGFGPFRTRQIIDLDAYAADGIFLIGGRTGAGKSSILDAVCFALYGSAPRYEDGEKRLRSDHARPDDPSEVALEFTTGGRTWRIERSPEFLRPKKRGDGFTPQKAEARMFERVDGDWIGRAARPVDVATLVDEVIGLTQQQFLQVILLAQGRFARFLLAKNDERQALLRTLFGTKRFEEYEKTLDERRKEAVARVDSELQALTVTLDHAEDLAGDILEPLGGDPTPEERIAWTARAALRARHLAEAAEAEQKHAAAAVGDAEAAHAERTGQRERQRRRDDARRRLADLDAVAVEMAALKGERDAATRAEPVRAPADAATRALRALDTAGDALEAARAAWAASGHTIDDTEALDAFAAEAQQRIGSWRPLSEIEAGLADEEQALTALRSDLASAVDTVTTLDERRAVLPGERDRIQQELDQATFEAAGLEAQRDAVSRLEQQSAAARTVSALADAQAKALADLQAAKTHKDEAETHLADLQRRRFSGMAGELAAALVAGEACSVCGSVEHPAPAERDDHPVTPEDIEHADRARLAAADAYEAANTALVVADRAHADALKDAGGLTADEAEAALTAARAELARIEQAAVDRERLALARAELTAETQRLDAESNVAVAERSRLEAAVATRSAALEQHRTQVAEARGDAASVAARIEAERQLAARAAAYAEAQREARRAEKGAVEASEALQRAIDDAGFADASAAVAALRDTARRETLDARTHEHDTAVSATRSTLLELELEALPEDPVDTTATAETVAAAKQAWGDAVTAHTAAASRAQALEQLSERVAAAHAQIADLAAEATRIRRLADAVAGRAGNTKRMKLETFVLAAELEEIVAAANIRLGEMSGERYSLQHSDALAARGAASGLGLEVMDRYTGRARPAHSLSGGETFLASLALALGLAEVVTSRAGGIRLDTLFIDEGFGSLDAETLDTAMRTLDELRQGGRTVGIISHVEAMKEQIPAQLKVEQTAEGWSIVQQDVGAGV